MPPKRLARLGAQVRAKLAAFFGFLQGPVSQFVGSLGLTIAVPLVPIIAELIARGKVGESTILITAAVYSATTGFASRNTAVFLWSSPVATVIGILYGNSLGAKHFQDGSQSLLNITSVEITHSANPAYSTMGFWVIFGMSVAVLVENFLKYIVQRETLLEIIRRERSPRS